MMNGYIAIALYLLVLFILAKPIGWYMAEIFGKEELPPFLRWFAPAESFFYRCCGVDGKKEMTWKEYSLALLWFSLFGVLFTYLLQRMQAGLPLNPQGFGAVTPDSSFNTAISFMTNTNWQGYAGETTMSYLTQMTTLAVQNFLSAACGIAVAVALIRGFARHTIQTIGNFWVDVTRGILYLLLPLSLLFALVLVSEGVVQNFSAYKSVSLVEPLSYDVAKLDEAGNPMNDADGNPLMETIAVTEQSIAMGPVASQEAIKMIGTNGGGFFNANSAHPYENPTPLSNFLQMLAIFLIPAGLCHTFGIMVGQRREGWAILSAMTIIFVGMVLVVNSVEQTGNPAFASLGIDQAVSSAQSGGNMEGKETRFGIVASSLFATITTAASCGAVNGMHDSFIPLAGMIPIALMQLGEVVFGGVGSGLYGMLVYAVIAVFIAGLMIGRTPEYLGKKIEAFDIKMASLTILIPPMLILGGTAIAVLVASGKIAVANPGTHGFSEILYAFTSAAANNGSAFAGISANTPFYNTALGIAMFLGRIWLMIPILALAGSLAAKKKIPSGEGTLRTDTSLFVWLLVGTVLLVGALTFIPALALGPVAEHLTMLGSH